MRQLYLGQPPNLADDKQFREWVQLALAEIERASHEDITAIAKDFAVTGHTPTRTIDAATATATDVADVLCTLIEDLQKRGMKRSQ